MGAAEPSDCKCGRRDSYVGTGASPVQADPQGRQSRGRNAHATLAQSSALTVDCDACELATEIS